MRLLIALVCAVVAVVQPAQCAELRGNPSNYRAIVRDLKPGDHLLLDGGAYRDGLMLHGVQGTLERPIVILGPAEGAPAEFVARAGHNTISLSNTAHVHISRLVLNGDNHSVTAIKAEGHKACIAVHHITLDDLWIVGHGASQGIVGIGSFCAAWNWIIRRNIIIGAGTGMYLGNSDGSTPFVSGLIEQNLIIDTVGYNLQIKHQLGRPAGIGMPAERTRTLVRHNVFAKVNNASTGVDARPNVLFGHFPKQGAGSDDHYDVTNNLFFCNGGEYLLQAEGNLSITRNVFINPLGEAITIRPHNDVPKHVDVRQNFVAATGKGIVVSDSPSSYTQSVADNRIYSPAALSGGKQSGNQIAAYVASANALPEWHAAQEFTPLITIANRLCEAQPHDVQRLHRWLPDTLRNHPVCQAVRQLSTAPVTTTASSRPPHANQCRWN